MVLYGINSVLERLKANPGSIKTIFIEESFFDKRIEKLIKENKVCCQRVSGRELKKIKPAKGLQKITARVNDFCFTPFNRILKPKNNNYFTVIFLDGINDPQNIGVIIRTAACLGGFALVLPQRYTCGINDTVIHVASGGENYLPIAKVDDLAKALSAAKDCGYTIAGSMASEDAEDIRKVNYLFPLGVVLGSEGSGIRKNIRKYFDLRVKIPMEGAKLSLNVNNACAIISYSLLLQRKGYFNEQ